MTQQRPERLEPAAQPVCPKCGQKVDVTTLVCPNCKTPLVGG